MAKSARSPKRGAAAAGDNDRRALPREYIERLEERMGLFMLNESAKLPPQVTIEKPRNETLGGALRVVHRLSGKAPLATIRLALEGVAPMEMSEGCIEMLELLGYRITEHC